jgi:hypothetical protein
MNSALNRVLSALESVKETGDQWSARCPAHKDNAPSLSIRRGDDGRAEPVKPRETVAS